MVKLSHLLLLTGLAAAATPALAAEQPYPTKPIRMLIGFPGGSSSDIVGRIVAVRLTDVIGKPIVFDNRPGAGGNIAAELVAKAAPDGYTLLYANTGIAVAHTAYTKLNYDVFRDLVPVAQAAAGPHILIVNVSLPAQSVKEFVALAKAKPRAMNVASTGAGNSDHFAYELFRSITGAELVHVPYKGGAQAGLDVMSGAMSAYFSGMGAALPSIRSGKVRALAVTSAKRTPIAPEVPTMIESGVPGYEHVLWNAVFAPAGTPKAVIARLDAAIAKAVEAPDVRERFAATGVEPASKSAAQMAAYLKSEADKYGRIVKAIGLKID